MKKPKPRIRKLTRALAKEANLRYYNNGVPCAAKHEPIIRITATGVCFHCWHERQLEANKKAQAKATSPVRYWLQFKKKDGTFEVIGPPEGFTRRLTAVIQYKKRYLREYGVPCPDHYFGPMDETELEDSIDLE